MMNTIEINTENIQLDQLLKWAGIVDSGGQVKMMLEEKIIFLNGNLVHEKRKKILPGDIIEITDSGSWKVIKK